MAESDARTADRQAAFVEAVNEGKLKPLQEYLDMPGGLTAGEHTLRLASHPERGGACAFRLVTVTGTIDSEKLLRGESTQMRLLVQGTDQPLELTITNRSPAQIRIAGGEDQSVMSSGGAGNNQIKIEADILGNRFEDYLNGLDGRDTPPESANVEQALEDLMREWSDEYPICDD